MCIDVTCKAVESCCHGGAADLHGGQKAREEDSGGQREKRPEYTDLEEVGPRIQRKLVRGGASFDTLSPKEETVENNCFWFPSCVSLLSLSFPK